MSVDLKYKDMKRALLIIGLILGFFVGCKKDDVLEASRVEMNGVDIKIGWDYMKMSGEYSYPLALESMKLYLSEKEDLSAAKVYECTLDEEAFSVDVKDLKDGVTYYYCYEYDNGYTQVKSEKESFKTVGKPIVVTKDVGGITKSSAVLSGSVTNNDAANKIKERGFCWGKNPNPTISGSHNNNGSSSGTGTTGFSYNLTNLTSGTKYYVRTYIVTDFGVLYGNEKSFVTTGEQPEEPEEPEEPEQPEIVLPTVTTSDVTNITSNSAACGGDVTSDGGGTVIARGVCWSETSEPKINNLYSEESCDGMGTGTFTSSLTNLKANTKYYVRAYATNEKGTSYGEVKSFVTLSGDGDGDWGTNQTFNVNGVSFTMIAVEGGTFKMGAQSSDSSGDNYDSDASSSESPVHSVTLSSYYIGETEVTQELLEAVMGNNPSYYSGYPQRPVEYVSWNDCQEFITKLNNLTGKNFRLPTEAEWEYAARGGNKSKGYKYSGGNTIGDVAWYKDNSSSQTHDVKTKQANELGIYDMSGNVCEWCHDWYGSYSSGSQTNPTGPASGSYRVARGGSWSFIALYCRVSDRFISGPDRSNNYLGLRLSLSQD